ncbi:MAG: AMP-binding protein [Acidobacteriaceae bacterium]|nr:AMP-binding protein [Acidobacteriaceae bacterium]MBV9780632.1 AMP-binding protein [Acidobacteriaceae bacterium]
MSGFAWSPTPAVIERAQLTKFLCLTGSRDYTELHAHSVADVPWFTEQVLRFLNVRFDQPYSSVLDLPRGPEWPRWCVNGKFNATESCLNHDAARMAVTWEGESGNTRQLTFGELREEVARAAAGLKALRIAKGETVGIYMPMLPETVVALLALGRIGAIAVPLFSGYGPTAIETRLKHTGAKALITCESFSRAGKQIDMLKTAKEAADRCPLVETLIVVSEQTNTPDGTFRWNNLLGFGEAEHETTSAEDPLIIIFSSGTTGEPKGIVHTHCSFPIKAAQDVAFHMDIGPGDSISWITDLGWMMGPWLIYGALILGGTVVLYDGAPDYPAPDRLWKFSARHHLDVLGISPSLIRKLIEYGDPQIASHNLSKLRFFASSGEPWDPASWWWLFEKVGQKRIPIINYSGGTEISGGILSNHPLAPIKPCGFTAACLGIDADVVDDSGNALKTGVGELAIRGPWIGQARGFWNDPDRYLKTYWERVPGLWIHGDWVEKDADEHWFILGRSDDTLKVAGKRLGPAEVESILTSYPGVIEAAVIGIPDEKKGTAIVGLCVARETNGLADRLRDHVASELGKPLKPERIHFVSALPKTRNGKIVRRVIRAAYLNQDAGDLMALENPGAVECIRNLNT